MEEATLQRGRRREALARRRSEGGGVPAARVFCSGSHEEEREERDPL